MKFNLFRKTPNNTQEAQDDEPKSPFTDEEYLKNLPRFAGENKEEDEKQKRFKEFERFFDGDLLVKNTMMDMAPTDADNIDEDSRIEYSDRLFDGLKIISKTFEGFGSSVPKTYLEKIRHMEEELIESGIDMKKMQNFYRTRIADMSQDFVEKVGSEVVGYVLSRYGGEDAETINEMLHFVHSNKINNEGLLQSLPVLDSYKINNYSEMKLYGRENKISRQIFEELQELTMLGPTDIVTTKDRIIMMVRDSGHALTMEIQSDEQGKIYVDYHIPKICNAKKVNLLPGVKKVPEDAEARANTSGIFQTTQETAADDIKNFIGMVPTDDDLP